MGAMMGEFRTKIGDDGRVVIPARCRKLMQLQPGDELVIEVKDRMMRIYTLACY